MTRLVAALTAAWLALPAAGRAADAPPCQDPAAIQWFTPGSFEEARQAAVRRKRLMMIKGIAFGIDAVGAKCATKGCW